MPVFGISPIIFVPPSGGEMEFGMKKFEFSKIILCAMGILSSFVTVFCVLLMWRTSDLSPMSYLIPSVFGELATATGFYYSKAKCENQIKLSKNKFDVTEEN